MAGVFEVLYSLAEGRFGHLRQWFIKDLVAVVGGNIMLVFVECFGDCVGSSPLLSCLELVGLVVSGLAAFNPRVVTTLQENVYNGWHPFRWFRFLLLGFRACLGFHHRFVHSSLSEQ